MGRIEERKGELCADILYFIVMLMWLHIFMTWSTFPGDCLTWNATIAIWNSSLPDQIGTLIDRFCPEKDAKEYILNVMARKIVIR